MLAGKTVAVCKVEREKSNQGKRSSTKKILDISLDGTTHARQNTITIARFLFVMQSGYLCLLDLGQLWIGIKMDTRSAPR